MSEGCSEWTGAITRLVDGELAAPERAALELHVGECDGCRAALSAQRATRRQWRETFALASAAADRATIVEMARGYLDDVPWWRRWLQGRTWEDLVVGVSMAVIVTAVVMLGQWRADPRSAWAPSSPAEYYVAPQEDAGQAEIPRPF